MDKALKAVPVRDVLQMHLKENRRLLRPCFCLQGWGFSLGISSVKGMGEEAMVVPQHLGARLLTPSATSRDAAC